MLGLGVTFKVQKKGWMDVGDEVLSWVLAETPAWLALHKPAGVVVIPGRDEPPGESVRHRLEAALGQSVWVVHRLDRGTSGVLLFARDAAAHRALSLSFERGQVQKTYLAFTRGVPSPAEGVIDVALHTARKGKMRPAKPGEEGAKPSQTAYRVVKQWEGGAGPVALVEAKPKTGRQHQLRVHLRAIGTPLLVDPLYGGCAAQPITDDFTLTRHPLHAASVTFTDPVTQQPVTVEAPLPEDLQRLYDAL